MVKILKSRLGSLHVFEDTSLNVCASFVESVTGDIRRALQLCLRAIELKQGDLANLNEVSESRLKKIDLISVSDMHAAKQKMRASNHYRLIAEATYFERLALIALVRSFTIFIVSFHERVFIYFLPTQQFSCNS